MGNGANDKKTTANAPSQSAVKPGSIAEFQDMLVLFKWGMRLFRTGQEPLQELGAQLNRPELEGYTNDGHTRYFEVLKDSQFFYEGNDALCNAETLAAYDLRIAKYWQEITNKRSVEYGNPLYMKYFQYLTLLVTELYLDWYFNRKKSLLDALNALAREHNDNAEHGLKFIAPSREQPDVFFREEDLNKVAFWEATGAGKTLLMHVNILQYRFYAKNCKTGRTIILTPNEGLSRQHISELKKSGNSFTPNMLQEDTDLPTRWENEVDVIDVGKLISNESNRKQGDKTMRAESFEGNNLVLVDEGHHGSSTKDGEHRKTRAQLCRDGFSFEYSATFGQAVAPRKGDSNSKRDSQLVQLYARNILFDYSYRYFYYDGYGKESFILNCDLPKNDQPVGNESIGEKLFTYLVTNLLKFYVQHYLYAAYPKVMQEFRIKKPLCVFVGNEVNAEDADVPTVIRFFAQFLNRKDESKKIIEKLIQNQPVFLERGNANMLYNEFCPIANMSAEVIYNDMLRKIFNTTTNSRLCLTYIPQTDELGLKSGAQSDYFGVVSIGGSDRFYAMLGSTPNLSFDLVKDTTYCGKPLFSTIDEEGSALTILIGARKFTEGWNAWRVSMMGLLNVGKNEGTQIIQLFGRGVRLQGRNFSLMRSQSKERPKGVFLEKLETLGVFGIHSDYMANFREYLHNEGVKTRDEVLTLQFPITKNIPNDISLKTLKTCDGYGLNEEKGFRNQTITLFDISDDDKDRIKLPHIEFNDFSYLESIQSNVNTGRQNIINLQHDHDVKLPEEAFEFFDWDKIYRHLLEHKAISRNYNMRLDKNRMIEFAKTLDWYTLYAPNDAVEFSSFDKLRHLQDLLEKMLLDYSDKFYEALRKLYESKHQEVVEFTGDDIPGEYLFNFIDKEQFDPWKTRLDQLKKCIDTNDIPAMRNWNTYDFYAIIFKQHLYEPLFYSRNGNTLPFVMRPLSFDAPSEYKFITELQEYYDKKQENGILKGFDIYLMRNSSTKAHGIGFGQAGNFYPDFMLWLINKETRKQSLTFVDPKGLRNMRLDSPKINFYKEIKALQKSVNEGIAKPNEQIILNSVILSDTPFADLNWSNITKEELESYNIFFLEDKWNENMDNSNCYLEKLLNVAKQEIIKGE